MKSNTLLTINLTQASKEFLTSLDTVNLLRKNLVAKWLLDENSQLYCQWDVED